MELNAPAERISWREKLSYGVGDLACSMVFNFMASYLFYFYTDVAGITVGLAGTIISTARLVDACVNPVVGVLSDRTRTRWGKLRPYLLVTAVPLALATVSIFLVPRISADNQFLYAFVTYTAFCILYTVCNVPYTALMTSITEAPRERSQLNMTKSVSASIGSLISMGLAMPLVALLGRGDEARGFLALGVLFGAIILSLVLVAFFGTRERIVTKPQKLSLRLFATTARKSRPWIILCLAQVCLFIASSTKNATTLYYAKYVLGASDFASVLLAMGAFTGAFLAFLMPVIVARFRKKGITQLGQVLFIVGCLMTFFAGDNLVLIFVFHLIGALGAGLTGGVSFLILGETIDHSEYATGNRQGGLFTSMYMFMNKMGVVLSGSITAFVLSMGGYVADVAQTEQALSAITACFIWIPIAAAAAAVIIFSFYNLDWYYAKINEELQRRHSENAH